MEEMLKLILAKMDEMNEQIGGLRNEMNGQIGGLRNEMNERFTKLEQDIRARHVENIEADNRLIEAVRMMNDRLEFIKKELNHHDHSMDVLNKRLFHVESEISKIKQD
ncbi:hypothetical protein [Paenibacillus silviterrae]|uniref:hypothetical protein n=1 Tax=Paenibacillus silviterrae TaxID=3242194 RepID=UPI002542C668|nr:hypothetical protein [Paenibacillus chinjuensis]